MTRQGSGYIGTDSLKTTSGINQEIIPSPPPSYPFKKYSCYELSFMNPTQDCTIVLNNTTTLFVPTGAGFSMDESDQPITSLIIKESGISYYFVAGVQ